MPKIRPAIVMRTYGDYLQSLFDAGLRLIPVERHSKATHEPNWQRRGESNLRMLLLRGAKVWGAEPDPEADAVDVFAAGFNIGVLNEPSGAITIDLDDPKALAALAAGFDAIGHQPTDTPVMSWDSVKGRKLIFKAPPNLRGKYAKLVVRDRLSNDEIKARTVFELRGTGYDLLPMSHREDEDYSLQWASQLVTLPALPEAFAKLMLAIIENNTAVITAMKLAAGCDPAMLTLDSNGEFDYPMGLAGHAAMRTAINGRFGIEAMLSKYGFIKHGKRWLEPGSSHADGVRQMKGDAGESGLWVCFHASSRISGQFDAWRLFVEFEHDGNVADAVAAARLLARPRSMPDNVVPIKPVDKKTAGAGSDRPAVKSSSPKSTPKTTAKITEPASIVVDRYGVERIGDYMALIDDVPVNYLTQGTMPLGKGLYFLAGKAKGGKTWLALGLSIAACLGETYMGTKFISRAECLYINIDDKNRDRFRRRVAQTGHSGNVPGLCHTIDWPPELDDGSFMNQYDALAEYLTDNPKTKLVVIDTYGKLRDLDKDKTKGIYTHEQDALVPYQRMANSFGVIILMLHHVNKLKFDVKDPASIYDSISGTTAMQGGTDGNFVLARTDEVGGREKTAILVGRTRDFEHELSHGIELKDGRWHHIGGSWMAFDRSARATLLETMLTDAGKVWTSVELHAAMLSTGSTTVLKTTQAVLTKMKNEGEIVTHMGPGGGYKLADAIHKASKDRKF